MKLYMTSDMGGITIKDGKMIGCCINEENNLLINLKKEIYGLIDGSYILVKDGISVLYGEAYLIKDAKMEQICEKGKKIEI